MAKTKNLFPKSKKAQRGTVCSPCAFGIFRIAITSPYPLFRPQCFGSRLYYTIFFHFVKGGGKILQFRKEGGRRAGRRACHLERAEERPRAQALGMAQGSRSRADSDPLPSPISCTKTSGISPTMTDSATSRRWLTVMGRDIRGRMSLISVSTSR